MAKFDRPKSNFKGKYSHNGRSNNKFQNNRLANSQKRQDTYSDSDSGPEIGGFRDDEVDSEAEEDDFFDEASNGKPRKNGVSGKKSKHAPKEVKISKRPVSVVRDIPGLEIKKKYTEDDESASVGGLHSRDIRFDTALGKSMDYESVRKQYAFLDEYREREIAEMRKVLGNKKLLARMEPEEVEELRYKLQSTQSKLESLRKKDREREALRNHIRESKLKGENKFLTRAEKRKVLLVDRFEHMNSKEKNKSLERKRKRKLGKEMRQLEFRHAGRE